MGFVLYPGKNTMIFNTFAHIVSTAAGTYRHPAGICLQVSCTRDIYNAAAPLPGRGAGRALAPILPAPTLLATMLLTKAVLLSRVHLGFGDHGSLWNISKMHPIAQCC